jgi:putative transferase (TIGR04331 family)
LEETWRADQPVLLIGEWCHLRARKESWSRLDAEVAPYHWDDRAKLFADYKYLQGLHERLLSDLASQLNGIHCTDHGKRYWRTVLGPWLGYFIQMLFDRWESIKQVTQAYELSGTVVLTGQEDAMVPGDMSGLLRLFCTDEWNHLLYARILQMYTAVPYETRECGSVFRSSSLVPVAESWKSRAKQTLANWYCRTANHLVRDQDCFFLGTGLPVWDEIRLCGRFGQVPQWWRAQAPARTAVDWDRRQWKVVGNNETEFEDCARTLIPQQIPTSYLEGYGQLSKFVSELPWPKRPKLIWTNNSFNANDVFKVWAAEKAEQGAAVVVGQHGGLYGVGRWLFNEDHEVAISDRYLSWGWSDQDQPKVTPVGQLSAKHPLGVRHEQQPGALLVTGIVPRQSYWMFSFLIARQWLDYFSDQCAFVQHLPLHIREALTVRLHSRDYGWSVASRWAERFPNLRLDAGRSDIYDLMGQSRLYIATYNATTYLESFTMDVPTIIFWNPYYWELRDSAIPYFDELERVGIFHSSPESAARHVAAIWNDVGAWWNSALVRDVLDRFKMRYCHLPDHLLDRVEDTLRDIMVSKADQTGAAAKC